MAQHNITGSQGEQAAASYLQEKGYRVIETNWRYLNTELDIILQKEEVLVVAEVKTRSSSDYGEPELAVDLKKQKNIIKAANAYIMQNGLNAIVRFDIVSVLMEGGRITIHHIEDAFYPMG